MQPLATRTHNTHVHTKGVLVTGMHGMLADRAAMKTDKGAARYTSVYRHGG